MKKGLLALGSSLTICLSMLATDMVVKQKNGEDWKINVDDVEEVFFEENAIIPEDSTVMDASETFLLFNILSDSTVEVTRESDNDYTYLGHDSITIPEKIRIDGKIYTVTSIGENVFSYCKSVTSINIPESVNNIGKGAFFYCSSLTNVNIPEGVTSIEEYTFARCSSLTSIKIPDGVTSIGIYAFDKCSSLTSIKIPDGVTSIGKKTFSDCSYLTSINIPESVTSIGESAFFTCYSLTSIDIPESVTSIERQAFEYCENLDIVINNSEDNVEVEKDAFEGCKSVTWLKD